MHPNDFVTKSPIEKGWSGDQKYCAVTADGTKYLLRVTPAARSANREHMFRMQQQVDALGVPICRPIAFGYCNEGVYTVQSWIEGVDAEAVLPGLSADRQYALGVESGQILRKIHTLPAPDDQPAWDARFNAKIDRKISMYETCPIHFDGAEALLGYIAENRHLLRGRPQCYQHGDYHVGNMMLENGRLVIIDFDRFDFGDPWEEFNRIVWCAQSAPAFAAGMVDGYFPDGVPELFWRLLALYISSNMLSSVPWAIPYGQKEIDVMLRQAQDMLGWYDHMRQVVPSWYEAGRSAAKV